MLFNAACDAYLDVKPIGRLKSTFHRAKRGELVGNNLNIILFIPVQKV
jgi:hypothetical protein